MKRADSENGEEGSARPVSSAIDLFTRLWARIANDNIGSSVARGALQSFIVNVVGVGVSFLVQILLARAMGVEGFGVYVVSLAAVNAFVVLAKLELDGATTRFFAGYLSTRQWSYARGFIRWSSRLTLGTSFAVVVLGTIGIWFTRERLAAVHADYPAALTLACLLLLTNAQLLVRGARLQALRRYAEAQFPSIVLRPAVLGLVVGVLYLATDEPVSPEKAVAANLFATVVGVGLLAILVRRALPSDVFTAEHQYERSRWLGASYGLLAIGVSQVVLSQQSDLLIVGTLVSTEDSALYSAAAQLSLLVGFAQTSLSFVAAPMIAGYYERGDHEGLQRLVNVVLRGNALVTVPLTIGLLVLGRRLLGLYGAPFGAAYPVLVILVISATVAALVGSLAGFLLTMTSFQSQAAWIIGGSAALNLILAILLTPKFGLMGTAAATLIATLARSVILVVFIRKRMGLRLIPT